MSRPRRSPKTIQVDQSVLASQRWFLAHVLLAADPGLQFTQSVDPFDGESLVIWAASDERIAVSLNSARGIEVLAEQLYAPLPWMEVLSSSRSEVLERIRATTGWPTVRSTVQSERAVRSGLMANLLATLSLSDQDWWVRCLDARVLDDDLPRVENKFTGLEAAMLRDFEESCASGFDFSAPWVLYRDATPTVAFDSKLQMWVPSGSLNMAELLDDLNGDLGELAGQILKYLR